MKNKNKAKIIDKKSVFIDKGVKIANNVIIYPNNYILGKTEIADGTVIGPNCYIKDCIVGENCSIVYSYLEGAEIKNGVSIGPFARIRPNTKIEQNVKIGNFVEVKNSCIGNGTKAGHLAYIGDAALGQNCNVGCGAIFVNYNGKEKNKTEVGDGSFIGSNVNLIAPVKIEKGTYITAGATVTENTDEFDFVIGRVKPTIKKGRAKKYLKNN